MAGAISVVLFIISAGLSAFVYNTLSKPYKEAPQRRNRL